MTTDARERAWFGVHDRRPAGRLPVGRLAKALTLTLLVSGLAGCAVLDPWRPADPSLDGWPLGPEMGCAEIEEEAGLVTLARSQLTGEAEESIVGTTCHYEGRYLEHGMPVMMSGGGRGIGMAAPIVFTFADGSRRAIGVGCGWWATEGATGKRVHDTCGLREPINPGPRS